MSDKKKQKSNKEYYKKYTRLNFIKEELRCESPCFEDQIILEQKTMTQNTRSISEKANAIEKLNGPIIFHFISYGINAIH